MNEQNLTQKSVNRASSGEILDPNRSEALNEHVLRS
jgi:hypothetical protein